MIVWQLILLAFLGLCVFTVMAKHNEGKTVEGAALATGAAMIGGVLLMITGFASVGGRNASETPAASSAPPATRSLPASRTSAVTTPSPPQPAWQTSPPLQAQYQPIIAAPPASASAMPTTPRFDLGAPGVAYQQALAIMMRYKQLYEQGVNDIQKTDLRFARGRELCQIGTQTYATVANLTSVYTNKNGDASLKFRADGMDFDVMETFGRGDPIHDLLGSVSIGTPVAITFTFQPDETGKDCFHSGRWTEDHNMTMPQWDIHLTYVQLLR